MREARDRDRDRDRGGVGPLPDASAAASLHSLSSDYDDSKKGYHSNPGGAQDDDCNSVLSSSNMHENRHPLSPCANSSPFGHHDQDPNTVRVSNSAHHFSHTELALLETTAVCPYRLVTTFEVRNTMVYARPVVCLESRISGFSAIIPSCKLNCRESSLLVLRSYFDFHSIFIFQASKRSLRLMMFQVFFLRFIARKVTSIDMSSEGSNSPTDGVIYNINNSVNKNGDNQSQSHILKVYNSSLGCPTAAMHSGMTEEHAAIMTVSNYPEFFQRVHLFFTPQQFTSMLRNAVRISVQRNYTTGLNLTSLGCCKIEKVESASESLTGIVDSGPSIGEIPWDDVWKVYALEREGGSYTADKVIEMRKRVSGSKRQFLQQQQQMSNRVVSPCRRSGYASGNNKATNNYNYMLRGNQSSYSRAGNNSYPVNNAIGRYGYGQGQGQWQGQGQGQGQGVGTAVRHPYRPKSSVNSNSGSSSGSAGSAQESAALASAVHNGSVTTNSNSNNSYNYNNNYSTNNSHSRNRPSQARNVPQKQDLRRASNSAENLVTLLSGSTTGTTPQGTAHSGQNSINSNSNNNDNNSNSNTKPRAKFSHKNSTMNNAMSVSGDRVRLHVFYQVTTVIVTSNFFSVDSILCYLSL